MNQPVKLEIPEEEQILKLPELIKKKRAEQGMTQKELAEASGLSISQVKQFETGRAEPNMKRIRQLATVLDLSANEILFDIASNDEGSEALRLAASQEAVSFATTATVDQVKALRVFLSEQLGTVSDQADDEQEAAFPICDKLKATIEEKGLQARTLPRQIERARNELMDADDLDMDDLFDEYDIDQSELSDELNAVDRVLVAIIYGEDLMQGSDKEIGAIIDWLHDESDSSNLDQRLFEGRETYQARVAVHLPSLLVKLAVNRKFIPETVLNLGS